MVRTLALSTLATSYHILLLVVTWFVDNSLKYQYPYIDYLNECVSISGGTSITYENGTKQFL